MQNESWIKCKQSLNYRFTVVRNSFWGLNKAVEKQKTNKHRTSVLKLISQ